MLKTDIEIQIDSIVEEFHNIKNSMIMKLDEFKVECLSNLKILKVKLT